MKLLHIFTNLITGYFIAYLSFLQVSQNCVNQDGGPTVISVFLIGLLMFYNGINGNE